MGGPKGAKNKRTLLREAELKLVDRGEFLDAMVMLEEGMRHFFAKAMHAKTNNGKPEIIDANMLEAVSIAEKIAPYRHHKLAAIKLNKDPEPGFRPNRSLEELEAEMKKHWKRLAPVLDLEGLVARSDGIANQEVQEGRLGTISNRSCRH